MIEKTVQAFRQLLSKGRPEILEVTRVIGIIISNLFRELNLTYYTTDDKTKALNSSGSPNTYDVIILHLLKN